MLPLYSRCCVQLHNPRAYGFSFKASRALVRSNKPSQIMNARGAASGRGRGRGQGRGAFRDRDLSRASSANVPSIREVVPGAGVSIVLKEDQPTGREVQGIVGELLTKGNHPRGIKVRLQDGRVGRVQRMWKGGDGSSSQPVQGGHALVIEESNAGIPMGMESLSLQPRAAPAPSKYSDFRTDGHVKPPSTSLSLEDYVVVKKSKGKGKGQRKKTEEMAQEPSEHEMERSTSTCPVCGEFEGDEAAVAHHVEEHFR